MQRLQAFKYELMPDGWQERQMRRFAGSCRFVFNKALALQKERHEQGEKKLGYAGLCKLLTEWRNSPQTAWLADAPVHPLQHVQVCGVWFRRQRRCGRRDECTKGGTRPVSL
ncbi:helix-turn-helix domain-containing protein [Pseudomonas sp. 21LCFQ010]|uniref:helix-turn-helix domain-containing protein n=1 Tax=Pseudomonas sp. 21LCFQ010 TaxID=2957506 RepID=UPI00209716C0|nr:helix-turn-helix domain-containing protein [Pseudomonas sp. 21LCFQ010]MCO8164376.1 helix-turn-helix domain-containing protein [Pseudomonas sp. 21LCFQ010]